MKARLKLVPAILGCLFAAAPAIAQGGAKLAVGPDAGGYLCPDGRQLYVKSCYDNSPDANCGIVLMHVPPLNGFQRESSSTRATLTSGVAACKVYPLEFRDGVVSLVLPKTTPSQQTAKAPAATPPPKGSTAARPQDTGDILDLTGADGEAIGYKGVPSSLVRLSTPGSNQSVLYIDVASRKPTSQKDIVTIWLLEVWPAGNPNDASVSAMWTDYNANCKESSYEQTIGLLLDRQAKVLSLGAINAHRTSTKNQTVETPLNIACKTFTPSKGLRFASAKAAIADASAGAAPKTVAKPAPPAPIRLPESENEKLFFRMIKESKFQGAVNTLIKSSEDKRKSLLELTDEQGMTTLHWAAANRSAAALRWLLDRGSKTDLADKKGRTPLRIALDNKDTQAMSVLLNIGRADAGFALPDRAEEMKGIKKVDDLIDFMIKAAGAKGQPG